MRADVIPQLADARRGAARASTSPTTSSVAVLIPNERGLDDALELRERFDEVNVFLSASRDAQPRERQPLGRGVAAPAWSG